MKYTGLILCCCLLQISMTAQRQQHYCSTKAPEKTILIDIEKIQRGKDRGLMVPEVVRVFVHFTTNDSGTMSTISIDTFMARLNDMRDYFFPHDICFLLAGTQIIQSTDLDLQIIDPPNSYDDDESDEVIPFIKAGMLNVFVHHLLNVNGNIGGGYAYNIPNHYLSIDDAALSGICCKPILAHEVGHCLGLYHTFQWNWGSGFQQQDRENVARVGGCANCATKGDLLCDTPADPEGLAYFSGGDTTYLDVSDFTTNCIFDTSIMDECADIFDPDESNIMSYFPKSCQNNFTTGQGLRGLYFLDFSLSALLAPENQTINSIGTHSDGEYFATAKQNVTFSSTNLNYTDDAILRSAAGNSVLVLPGTTFSPDNGFVSINAQEICN